MQCPQCKNEVPVAEAHYGALYTCPKCMAVYFINFEGQPEYGDMTQPEEPLVYEPETEVSESLQMPAAIAAGSEPNFENNFDIPADNNFSSMIEPDVAFEAVLDATPEANSFDAVAEDIASYANGNEEISSINYEVFIRGLDTKEVVLKFKEAVDDAKFGWILEDILAEIKNGEMHFKNLNPIQAYVLASRIQFLNLEIEWRQNVAF